MLFFPAIISVIAVVAAFFITVANADVYCHYISYNIGIDQDALHTCLENYRNGNWDGEECGGYGWFKGGFAYADPDNCYDACESCIDHAITAFADDVQCDDYEGVSAHCWMGYH
jgi:hypothetical protein